MADLTREQMEALGKVFNTFALDDQRNYYRSAVTKYRRSASQINLLRAAFSFLTGLASALAGLLVLSYLPDSGQCLAGESACRLIGVVVFVLLVIAVVAPVFGGAFSSLSDLFQWDRLVNVYSTALENIEVADALSPDPELDETKYRASYNAYTSGTLQVMRDESAQWGQLIRTPAQIEKFLAAEMEKAERISGRQSGVRSENDPTG